jgi:hypothetical protein
MLAHHDILFSNTSSLFSGSTAGDLYVVPKSTAKAWIQKYRRDGPFGRRRGSGLWRVSSPVQVVALVAEAQKDPFFSVQAIKAASDFLGSKNTVISRLKEASFNARRAAVTELLTDEHQLYRL